MNTRTRYFRNCLGVFAGGGAKGFAYLGACEVAFQQGVRFNALAGTSAGAIFAALLATGKTPGQILEIIDSKERIEKGTFFETPEGDLAYPVKRFGAVPRLVARFIPGLDGIMRAYSYGGMWSGAGLQRWVNRVMARLLEVPPDRQISFADLPIPLHIIATDLAKADIAIWSRQAHPEMPVAAAVRHSASLPVLYQPSKWNDRLYYDGGLVANVPVVAFNSETGFSNILVFRTDNSTELDRPAPTCPKDLLLAAIEAIVEGSTKSQIRDSDMPISQLSISVQGVSTEDIEKLANKNTRRALRDQGRAAAEDFFEHEGQHVRESRIRRIGDDQFLLLVCQMLQRDDLNWIELIVPDAASLDRVFAAVALTAKAQVTVVVPPTSDPGERRRRATLLACGVAIREVRPAWEGILAGAGDEPIFAAVREPPSDEHSFERRTSTLYAIQYDRAAISALRATISTLRESRREQRCTPKAIQRSAVEAYLRRVPQYGNTSIRFVLQNVEISSLFSLERNIREFRLIANDGLFEWYSKQNAVPYEPLAIGVTEGYESPILPPVIEVHGRDRIIIEGVTRCYAAMRDHQSSVKAIVLTGVTAPLPGQPIPLDRVAIASTSIPLAQNMLDPDTAYLRPIERGVRAEPPDLALTYEAAFQPLGSG